MEVEAEVKGGSLDIRDYAGKLALKCMGGSIQADGRIEGLDLKCMGGSVALSDLHIVEGTHRIVLMGGSLSVGLAPDASLRLTADTFGGNVMSDIPAHTETGQAGRKHALYQIGDGRASLNMKTLGGTVEIHSRP